MSVEQRFAELASCGAGLPLPGSGRTLRRWQVFAEVAAEDLAVAKLFESHADAVAILHELGRVELVRDHRWAVWAAEPPDARLTLQHGALRGRKAWCSGAAEVDSALVTAWDADGNGVLAAVELSQPGITVRDDAWRAIGMGRVRTPDLEFADVPATIVGGPAAYLQRPGFWQGGCGIAACWYGGALPLARAVAERAAARSNPHTAALLGTIDVALRSLRALLRETAARIDADPAADRAEDALRVRAAADETARVVLDAAGRALGAGPLCRDATIARHFADLPVFIRQTHAERDLAALAERVLERRDRWEL